MKQITELKRNHLLLERILINSETMKLEHQQAIAYALDIIELHAKEKFNIENIRDPKLIEKLWRA